MLSEVIRDLLKFGISLSTDGVKLDYVDLNHRLTSSLRWQIKKRKPELIDLLQKTSSDLVAAHALALHIDAERSMRDALDVTPSRDPQVKTYRSPTYYIDEHGKEKLFRIVDEPIPPQTIDGNEDGGR